MPDPKIKRVRKRDIRNPLSPSQFDSFKKSQSKTFKKTKSKKK